MKTLKIPRRRRAWTDAELEVWAAAHPPGTPVRYWPTRGRDEHVDTAIRSEPWMAGRAIVKIEGIAGGVALDHLTKLPAEAPCGSST